jgi:DNA-binding Lrp family transcriptional regulator
VFVYWYFLTGKILILPKLSAFVSALLDDASNLAILENICSGVGVEVNISNLAKTLKRHRDTIRNHVKELFDYRIINEPIYPFIHLYQEYPLMVIVRADLPRTDEISKFFMNDANIFGAFYVKDGEYNTFLIMFHKDLPSYIDWRKRITVEKLIPPREDRYPASGSFFSNKHIIKYQPYSPIYKMEEKHSKGENVTLNGLEMRDLSFQILKQLMLGESIRTNENLIAKEIGINRKTIERRISTLLDGNIITKPCCRFPRFFVPPDHILVYYLLEIRKSMNNVIKAIKSDPCIPFALEASLGRYNLLLFQVFSSVDEHLQWEDTYIRRFPDSLGAMYNIYLAPNHTASINQQKISLSIIRKRKELLYGSELKELVR